MAAIHGAWSPRTGGHVFAGTVMPSAEAPHGRWLFATCVYSAAPLVLLPAELGIVDAPRAPFGRASASETDIRGWIDAGSGIAIWGACAAMLALMVFLVLRRRDIVFPRAFWFFAAFLLGCGTMQFVDAVNYWWPAYRLSAIVRLTAAVVSWATVIALVPVLSRALILPSRIMDVQTIIENAPTSMLVANHRGQIVMVNRQTEELFGYHRLDLIGRQIEMLVPRSVREEHPNLVRTFFSQPKITQLGEGRELYGCHKDGHEIPVEIGLTPLTLDGESAVLACIVNQTVRKLRRERELSELSHVLSLGEVIGGLAHELNTPVQRIVTWSGVLQLDVPSDNHREPIQRIVTASKEVGEIVHRLRDAVIRRDTIDQSLDLNAVIQDTIALMHREVTGVRTQLADDLPPVSSDPVQLQLVLSNLIRNAYQAGGPVTITTSVRDGQVVCSVEDCGPGFHVEPRQLFEPLYTTKTGGLGMGLTISQAIVRRHGGRIAAYQKEQGARFEFTLPAR